MKTDLSTYNNTWYKPGSTLKISLWYFVNVLFFINPLNPISSLKVFLLKLFGAKIGSGVVIKPGVNIKYPWLLTIGDYSWIGEKVWIDNLAKVTIGNHVCVSQEAMLLCGNHNYKKTTFDLLVSEITIDDGAWVGAKTVVCPGVNIKSHAILTVNSVATKTLEAYYIYQGNPARQIRKREIE
ncbi:WcaF family extracellular polysaccharide biosynthesis acetyltransferase [Formosa algae]|uniref:Colanic acid biosynthesis acetyltransferase WcaF n=1 Tax=Formosa algae TaxID=225843 RepID=A0A9X0YHQ2_9FLAO|nr:WcaF family extracellular polysaccharide biosynthesis acetyltransferase [Formosa algae]MBP1839100.1 putative colanic acid biosynthesis acetyltransferase WcaF [Formosa algae]MDQ0333877.1 putative colanic acid biosynthesis acetyltransferase WcaF [Formosa algae]OEI80936.1 colanic acid biosynthesis acetyltransferase WcaF [Formosa algae]PNW26813.1 colanic acid biosynthesis acetyltransferase WcaF [Formosa algae]